MKNEYDFKEKIKYKLFKNNIASKDIKGIKIIFGEEFVKNNKSKFK